MKEIKFPKCDAVFEMDAMGYTEIVNQIRGQEFENELSNRLKDQESKHEVMVKLAQQDIATKKDKEILDLRHQIKQHETEIEIAKNEARDAMRGDLFAFEKQVERLKNERKAAETETKLAVSQATNELEKKISDLEVKLELAETRKELKIEQMEKTNLAEIKAKDDMIRLKDEEIARVKDMKLKMSVKEIGEKLEQWCENQFNLVRATAFPQAFFEKDNESVKDQGEEKGTKGDYIFRDYDSNGVEYISIMFEMKDKMEGKKGQTNESHLAKLDKDRKKRIASMLSSCRC